MIDIEHRLLCEHQLRYQAKTVKCHQGHVVATHSTDHGFCLCGWEMWSRDGRAEILEAHGHHLEFVRRKQQEQERVTRERAASLHQIVWNEMRDAARCSWCGWSLAGQSMPKLLIAFDHHVWRSEKESG